jgi:hypothetical protein
MQVDKSVMNLNGMAGIVFSSVYQLFTVFFYLKRSGILLLKITFDVYNNDQFQNFWTILFLRLVSTLKGLQIFPCRTVAFFYQIKATSTDFMIEMH